MEISDLRSRFAVRPTTRAFRRWSLLLLLVVLAVAARSASADPSVPFPIRNLNPLAAIFGLPAWRAIGPGTEVALTTELANHYRFSVRGSEALMLDGETWRTNLYVGHTFRERWRIGIDLPYFRQSGGVLDDLIDGWHSAFGLPDGGRNARPEGALDYLLADAAGPFFELRRSSGGSGDAQLSIARHVGGEHGYTVQATAKLPTGEEALLAGSGSADWSVTLLRARTLLARTRPGGWFWGVGLLGLGEPEQIRYDTRSTALLGIVGGGWQLGRRFGLKAQLDVHTPLYDSRLEEIGQTAIQATLGAWLPLGERGVLDLAVVEDVHVSTAPDVVLHATVRWAW